ncbi:hypothetical protein [Azospirillum argentinense]
MAKIWVDKASFGAGELSPNMARRSDTQQHADGARKMRNVRALNAGGFTRRPGSLDLGAVHAGTRLIEFTFNIDQQYLLAFSAGRMDAFTADGVPAGSIDGCPWTPTDVQAMTWVQSGDTVFIACRSWRPQVLTRTDVAAWAVEAWTADKGVGGALLQPYAKFAPAPSTIKPSGRVGYVNIIASDPSFAAGHVGQMVRYAGCEIVITEVHNPWSATGMPVQVLPPSVRITLNTLAPFRVGHIVEGRNTGTKGEVIAVNAGANTIDVLVDGERAFGATEEIDAPLGRGTASSVVEIAPLPARDWDEPYLSSVHGYPGAVGLHRQRLWLGGHPRMPSSVLASRVGAHYDFDIGTGEDAQAIFEDLGDGVVAWVRHFQSAEHLLIFTDQGVYYVPETAANPLRPSSIQFNKISANGCGTVRPQPFDEGVLFAHLSGGAVLDLRPTGDVTKSWSADDVALLASHLIRQPTDVTATHGADGLPERYAFFVNADGTLAVMHSIQSQQVLGWSLWETDGAYRSVVVLAGKVFAVVERAFPGGSTWRLERFDQALMTDGAAILPPGSSSAPLYGSMAAHFRAGNLFFGAMAVRADGTVEGLDVGAYTIEAGRFFRPLVETLPPEPKLPGGGTAGRVKRVSKVRTYVQDTIRINVGGRALDAYRVGEDVSAPPAARTEWVEVGLLGRSHEPTVTITQDEPLPLTVLGMSMEVII